MGNSNHSIEVMDLGLCITSDNNEYKEIQRSVMLASKGYSLISGSDEKWICTQENEDNDL